MESGNGWSTAKKTETDTIKRVVAGKSDHWILESVKPSV
jgi:hypothetical protein